MAQPLNAQSGRRSVIFQWVKPAALGRSQRVLANWPPRWRWRVPVGQMCWRLWLHATGLYRQTGRWRAIAAGGGASGGCSRLRRHNRYQTACDVQNWILPNTDTPKPTHIKTQTLLKHWRSKTLRRWASCACRTCLGMLLAGAMSISGGGLPSGHSPKFAALL